MYKIFDSQGRIFYAQSYRFVGDSIVLDDFNIISGRRESFTVQDLDAPPAPDQTEWLIDVGPFFDRFGSAKLNVLTSTHPYAKAVVQDVMVRKWIDLQRPDVASGIDVLIGVGVPGVDSALKKQILETPVAVAEKVALTKLYFSR